MDDTPGPSSTSKNLLTSKEHQIRNRVTARRQSSKKHKPYSLHKSRKSRSKNNEQRNVVNEESFDMDYETRFALSSNSRTHRDVSNDSFHDQEVQQKLTNKMAESFDSDDESTNQLEKSRERKKLHKVQKENFCDKRPSDDPCPICLGAITNACAAETCLHRFCFGCLKAWTDKKNNCPLCKCDLSNILYDIKTDDDYKIYSIPIPEHPPVADLFNSVFVHQFQIVSAGPPMDIVGRSHFTMNSRRRIYQEDLWVKFPNHGQVRLCSPSVFRDRPGRTHRLFPWVRRELRALGSPKRYLNVIIENLSRYPIMSRQFRSSLRPHMKHNTEHFLHELNCFAHSSYDMVGYDRATMDSYGPYHARIGPPEAINIDDEVEQNASNVDEHIEIDLTTDQSDRPPPPPASPPLEVVMDTSTTSMSNSPDYKFTFNLSKQKKRSKRNTRDIDETNLPEALIESIVISSSDEDASGSESTHRNKKIKLRRDPSFLIGESSQGCSRAREPKDHPSRIKSSKKTAKTKSVF